MTISITIREEKFSTDELGRYVVTSTTIAQNHLFQEELQAVTKRISQLAEDDCEIYDYREGPDVQAELECRGDVMKALIDMVNAGRTQQDQITLVGTTIDEDTTYTLEIY